MSKKRNKRKMLRTNVKISFSTLLLAFLLLGFIYRLVNLQIVDKYQYKTKGNVAAKVGKVIKPERGNILDRNGNPLAISRKIDSLYLLPVISEEESKKAKEVLRNDVEFEKLDKEKQEELRKQASKAIYKNEEIQKIAKILDIKAEEIYKLIDKGKEGFIYNSLNKSQKSQIELLNLPYLLFMPVDERFYPNNELASNAIGFIEDDVAKYGLEKYYDKFLSGESGYREFYKSVNGTEIPYTKTENKNSEDAKNIKSTIDIELQNILYKHLKDAMITTRSMSATAVLMNPNNGEVLAMQSFPTFDSNKPRDLSSEIDKLFLSNLDDKKQVDYLFRKWENNAVSMEYDPGSVYKVVTTAIALETNSDIKKKIYQDDGFYELAPGVVIKSWRFWDPHGPQNLREALKNSSNPVFVQVAKDIGKEKYVEYGHTLRLGKKTGIDLPNEINGFFPKDANISDVDFGTISYGHYVNVSPIQILSTLNSIVNGGRYYKPRVVKEIMDKSNEKVFDISEEYLGNTISETTSKEVKEYLEYTAESYGLNTEELKFGAKTGTTEKYNTHSIFKNESDTIESVFTSIFVTYPSDNPKYTLLVVFDEPLSHTLAADTAKPVAKDIMYDVAEYDLGRPLKNDNNKDLVKIPNLIGKTFEEASKILDESNILAKTNQKIGRYNIISDQNPKENNLIRANSSISLRFSDNIKVPSMIDMNTETAKKILELNNVNYKISGEGDKIISQSIKEGEIINQNQEIIFYTEER
ncbi:PASTA domain-containing protein [Helcococcus kunzii]|uniref:peptidoglycan D,D-transpeptidase FtsI family protein n=1 Tax=Helcococcus kunzii TaxID=40091 RepID=UPI001C98074F|nr:penicillin-binding protein 2 [Helcococcus kunzii]QZO77278.1 PASTA domain-containing protein [Helcococcus kunzii]